MRSRSWVVIVAIGVLGLVAMGMITKFVFDSNPALRRVARFKADLLGRFSERGVQSVSYRRVPGERMALLALVVDPERISPDDPLHHDIAEEFFRVFPRRDRALKLAYSPPATWGLFARGPFLELVVPASEIQERITRRNQCNRLITWMRTRTSLELVDADARRDRIRVEVRRSGGGSRLDPSAEGPGAEEPGAEGPGAEEPRETAARVAREVASIYRPARATRIDVVIVERSPVDAPTRAASTDPGPPSAGGGRGIAHAEGARRTSVRPRAIGEWRHDHRGRPQPSTQESPVPAPGDPAADGGVGARRGGDRHPRPAGAPR